MEPIQYWSFFHRWWKLILAAPLVSLIAGFAVLKVHPGTSVTYTSSASVVVNYITPAGVPYNPTFSPRSEVALLTERGHAIGFQRRVASQTGVRWTSITGINLEVDPTLPLITVHVTGLSAQAGQLARGLGNALASVEIQRVANEEKVLRTRWHADMLSAEGRWRDALVAYNAATLRGDSPGTVARLQAIASLRQEDYITVKNEYDAVNVNPVPPATVQGWVVTGPITTHPSLARNLMLAVLLGLLLGIGLAAIVDYYSSWRVGRQLAGRGHRSQPDTYPLPVPPVAPLTSVNNKHESTG